jgi:hypothetical protein
MLLYGASSLLDAADGYAARALNQTSEFGAVLDMVTDRYTSAPTTSLVPALTFSRTDAQHHVYCATLLLHTPNMPSSFSSSLPSTSPATTCTCAGQRLFPLSILKALITTSGDAQYPHYRLKEAQIGQERREQDIELVLQKGSYDRSFTKLLSLETEAPMYL